MHLNVFLPLSCFFFFNSFRRIDVSSSQNVWLNLAVKPSDSGPFFFFFLRIFKLKFIFQYLWLVFLYFLFLSVSILGDCIFLRVCSFLQSCSFYLHTVAWNSLLYSSVFVLSLLQFFLSNFIELSSLPFLWV